MVASGDTVPEDGAPDETEKASPEAEKLAAALFDGLMADYPNGYFGRYGPGDGVWIDGNFDLIAVASRPLRE